MFSLLVLLVLLSLITLSLSYNVRTSTSTSTLRHTSLLRNKQCHYMSSSEVPPTVSSIKTKLNGDMKEAMKAKDKERLAGIRAITTAIKQMEVDQRIDVTDEITVTIMTKLIKQRKESIKSYQDAGRPELVEAEQKELDVITTYMPEQLSTEEVSKLIDDAITEVGATTVKDMGKVMAILRPKLAGKADASEAGDLIKKKLSK